MLRDQTKISILTTPVRKGFKPVLSKDAKETTCDLTVKSVVKLSKY